MTTKKRFDETKIFDARDLEAIMMTDDPDLQETIFCSITTYRRPDRLHVGDPVPALKLVALGGKEKRNLATRDGRPTVLIFGSYT